MFQTLGIAIIALIVSIIVLVKSSDIFIGAASRLAKSFGVSEFVIGLTVVSMGTSLPELATSIAASIKGDSGIVVGNIAGSNIANIGLILAIPLLFTIMKVGKKELDGVYMVIFSALLFLLFSTDFEISTAEAVILLLIFSLYMNGVFKVGKKLKEYQKYSASIIKNRGLNGLISAHFLKIRGSGKDKEKNISTIKALISLAIGIVFLAISSKYTVISAIDLSQMLKIPQVTVAAVLIAIGTSLPELFVSIRGIKKGYKGMVFGNIIGSNIFNILAIGGVAGLIRSIAVSNVSLNFILPAMLLFSLALFFLLKKQKQMKLRISDGAILLALYVIFVILLLKSSFVP